MIDMVISSATLPDEPTGHGFVSPRAVRVVSLECEVRRNMLMYSRGLGLGAPASVLVSR